MPAVHLSPEQQVRHAKGLCACPCGERIEERARWEPQLYYAGPGCKDRAYRERRASGDVVSREDRRRAAVQSEIDALGRTMRSLRADAGRLSRQADAIEDRIADLRAQLQPQLPGIEKMTQAPRRKGRQ